MKFRYINRVQRGEWLALFREKGFELVEEEARRIDISGLKLADRYANIERSDLECTVLKLVLRKPARTASSHAPPTAPPRRSQASF